MLNDHQSGREFGSISPVLSNVRLAQFGLPPRYQTISQLNSLGRNRPLVIIREPAFNSTHTKTTHGSTLMKFFKKLFCKKKLTPCEELNYRVEEHKNSQGEVFFLAVVTQAATDLFASYYDGGPKWRYKKTIYWRSQVGYSSFGGITSCKVQFPDKDLAKDMCIERCREIRNLKHNRVVEEGKCQSE